MRTPASPLRLTWDWDWPPVAHPGSPIRRPPAETVRAVGAEIVRARVLLLEIGYPDPEALRSGELAAALDGFEGRLSLVLAPDTAAALVDERPWAMLHPETVWLDATPGEKALPPALTAWPAVRYYLTAGNCDAVATAIATAVAGGAVAISLPNLPLFGEVLRAAETAMPRAGQLGALATRIAAALDGRPVDLRVHHYRLSRELRAAGAHLEGEEEPGAGCQAGSALGYIDPTGVIHPCAALPVPLARAGADSLGEAWAGAELAALRAALARLPQACAGCDAETTCRGGCRGWAHYLTGNWNTPGPDCHRQ